MFKAAAAAGGATATAAAALAVVCLLSASARTRTRTRSRICNDYYAIMKIIAVFRIQICWSLLNTHK